VHNRSEDLGRGLFGLRSTVRASKLHSQKEGACDACSRAHPTQKERALIAYHMNGMESWPVVFALDLPRAISVRHSTLRAIFGRKGTSDQRRDWRYINSWSSMQCYFIYGPCRYSYETRRVWPLANISQHDVRVAVRHERPLGPGTPETGDWRPCHVKRMV
jgi:hypothetical protein